MKPLLAHVYEPHRITFPCYIQPKFNGVRALYQGGRFQSRDELPWAESVLSHIAQPLLALFGPEVILDGELYVHGWSLQRINGAVQIARSEASADTLLVSYVIYDKVDFTKSFIERFQELESVIGFGQVIGHDYPFALATTTKVHNQTEVNRIYSLLVSDGFEGIMYRLGDCPYTYPKQPRGELYVPTRAKFLSDQDNRTWHLLKRKAWQDEWFTIVDIEEGTGKQENMVGAIVCQTLLGERFRVGTGLTDREATAYFQNPPIGRKAKVKFLTYTDRGVPYNASIEEIS